MIGVFNTIFPDTYNLDYYDLEGKETGADTKVLWSRLQINF